MSDLSSRERLLAAMRCQEPDHVPVYFTMFGFQPPAHLAWSDDVQRVERLLSIGVDATLSINPPIVYHPDVKVRSWEEQRPGERWPVMIKEYDTPAGALRQEVYRTEDWVSPEWPLHSGGSESVALLDDYNVVRSRRFPVETEEDLEKLKYLLWPLSDRVIKDFTQHAAARHRQAQRLGVLLESYCPPSGTDMLTWLCGVEGMVYMAVDKPDLFDALREIIHQLDKRRVEILLDTPVDVITQRGFYEGAAFWSPALYRRFSVPRLKELTAMAHQGGRLMGYLMSTGFMPLLAAFLEIGYDVHYYIDPVMGGPGTDLQVVKRAFGNKIAVHGGMNSAVTLEQGTREEIRQAVFDAVSTLGPGGGFILCPVDCLAASTPWDSVQTLLEAWRQVRDYPIRMPGT